MKWHCDSLRDINSKKFLVLSVIILAGLTLFTIYYEQGPGWDLIAHYLNGRSLSQPAFYQCLLSQPCRTTNQNVMFYFEPQRAPIAGFTLALLYLIFNLNTIWLYIAVVFVAYLLSIWFMSKKLGINLFISLPLMLSPLVLYTSIVAGSEEILSLIFLFISLGFLARRSPLFGLFLGLATMGKYPALIFIPTLLLLYEPKKILYAAILFALVVTPWLIFNQIFLGGAFYSYLFEFTITLSQAQNIGFNIGSLIVILEYPIIFGGIAIAAVYGKRKRIARFIGKKLQKKDLLKSIYSDDRLYVYSISCVFLALSIIDALYLVPQYNPYTQIRYGYLLSIFATFIVVLALNDASKIVKFRLDAIILIIAILFLLQNLLFISQLNGLYATSPIFQNAKQTLTSLGYGNCKVVSNDWVYLLYDNVKAFNGYFTNATENRYPIVAFYNQAISTSTNFIPDLNASSIIYSSHNYSILLPNNSSCYT